MPKEKAPPHTGRYIYEIGKDSEASLSSADNETKVTLTLLDHRGKQVDNMGLHVLSLNEAGPPRPGTAAPFDAGNAEVADGNGRLDGVAEGSGGPTSGGGRTDQGEARDNRQQAKSIGEEKILATDGGTVSERAINGVRLPQGQIYPLQNETVQNISLQTETDKQIDQKERYKDSHIQVFDGYLVLL